MNALRIFVLMLLPIVQVCAQGTLELSLRILNKSQQPFAGARITLREQKSGELINRTTNANGQVQISIDHGNKWDLLVNDYLMEGRTLTVPPSGKFTSSMELTYDPARMERYKAQSTDRSGLQNEEMPAGKDMSLPPAGFARVRLDVVSVKGQKQPGKKVRLVDLLHKRSYTAVSDEQGQAYFKVPVNTRYDVDVEEQLNAMYIDVGSRNDMMMATQVHYDISAVKQQQSNDTLRQQVPANFVATYSQARYAVLARRNGLLLISEPVFLQEIHGTQVYRTNTNAKGEAVFALPLGKKFMIHFRFQRDVDVIDLSRAHGEVNGIIEVAYVPNPRLEHPEIFIPTPDRLFLQDIDQYLARRASPPKPPDKVGIDMNWLWPDANTLLHQAVLQVALSSAPYQPQGGRKPVNMSFVIDRSGSMAGYDRIERLKESFAHFVQRLGPDDMISIVLFDDETKLLLPATKVGNRKQEIVKLINDIEPQGGTNMLEAMKEAYRQVEKNLKPGGSNRVILLTDGYDSNEPQVLLNAQKPYNGRITCTAIGVGADYNHELLQKLATHGGDVVLKVVEAAEMDEVFNKRLTVLMPPIGKDVQLEIVYTDPLVYQNATGLDSASASAHNLRFHLPDIYPDMNKAAIVRFAWPAQKNMNNTTGVTISISYTDASGKRVKVEKQLQWDVEKGKGGPQQLDEFERKLYAVASANQLLGKMAEAHSKKLEGEAEGFLLQCHKLLRELYPQATSDSDIQRLLNETESYREAFRNLATKKALER